MTYFVLDHQDTIWGRGDTEDEAWESARSTLMETFDEDEVTDEQMVGFKVWHT